MKHVLLITGILLLAPLAGAAAPEDRVRAESVQARGQLTDTGHLLGFALHQKEGPAVLHNLSLQAGKLVIQEFTRTSAFVRPGACEPQTVDPACRGVAQQVGDPERHRYPATGAFHGSTLTASESAGAFIVHAFPLDEARLVGQAGHMGVEPLPDACITPRGIEDPAEPCTGYNPTESAMSMVPLGDVAAVTNATGGGAVRIVGDFVVEVEGITLETDDGSRSWWSGDRYDGDAAGTVDARWLRLIVEGGVLELSYGSGAAHAHWALAGGVLEALESTITLHQARGRLDVGDIHRTFDDETAEIAGDFLLATHPGDDGLALDVQDAGSAEDEVAPTRIAASDWLWVALPAVALAAAAVVAVMRRRVSMEDVEAALEAGEYGKAARLATRLLRRDPLHESAVLGRAIAWERGGRPARVVPSLRQYLQEHEPHDGALHFVLGLAHLDLGEEQAAKAALAEATRRTPALMDEIAPELRPRPTGGAGYS